MRLKNYSKSHRKHAIEFTGLPKDSETHLLFTAYKKICNEFFKQKIDEITVDGFIDADEILHIYNKETNVYGMIFKDNKIGSIYHLDGGIDAWQLIKKRIKKKA